MSVRVSHFFLGNVKRNGNQFAVPFDFKNDIVADSRAHNSVGKSINMNNVFLFSVTYLNRFDKIPFKEFSVADLTLRRCVNTDIFNHYRSARRFVYFRFRGINVHRHSDQRSVKFMFN